MAKGKRAASYRLKFGDEQLQKELSAVTHVAQGKNIPPFLILHVADHPETKAQSQRLVKALQEVGVSAKAYPAEGKNHTTINADLGLPEDKATQQMWEFPEQGVEEGLNVRLSHLMQRMTNMRHNTVIGVVLWGAIWSSAVFGQVKPLVGLIPKVRNPIPMDGRLTGWDGAFVTPVHVGHPDFPNRGGQFLYLWDEKNLYIGMRCLDQKPAHIGTDNHIWNGDAVEFDLDTRRGDNLGATAFGPGTLHLFFTPFTRTEVKPRMQVRDMPAFRDFKLQGAEVTAARTTWGYTAEFQAAVGELPRIHGEDGRDHRHRL